MQPNEDEEDERETEDKIPAKPPRYFALPSLPSLSRSDAAREDIADGAMRIAHVLLPSWQGDLSQTCSKMHRRQGHAAESCDSVLKLE